MVQNFSHADHAELEYGRFNLCKVIGFTEFVSF